MEVWTAMPEPLLRPESPTEFFRDRVEAAMRRQRVEVGELTSFYVVNLLAGFVHQRASRGDEALGIRFIRALQSGGAAQRKDLRHVGDTSLFISGFFSDSLNRRLIDIDYYIQLGERAYGSLAQTGDAFGDVFDELSTKFPALVDVLTEVSEQSALTTNADLLREYERWVLTRSKRSGAKLASRGILPVAPGTRRVQ
jgi:hypothetical protein